jgi:hypothetical protein
MENRITSRTRCDQGRKTDVYVDTEGEKGKEGIEMPSARNYLEAREYREFVAAEEKETHDREDRAEYAKYENEMRQNRTDPLSFEQWRSYVPEELKNADAVTRGAAASAFSTFSRLNSVVVDRIRNGELTNDELQVLGFDPSDRVFAAEALSVPAIAADLQQFAKSESRYLPKIHGPAISEFFGRNKLFPSNDHIRRVFCLLFDLHLLPEPPEPEPERPKVNLEIERDPVLEARKRREKYEREVVVTDPENGKGWTAYMLDHVADSETYRRLMRIPRVYRNPGLEPQR